MPTSRSVLAKEDWMLAAATKKREYLFMFKRDFSRETWRMRVG
jgi:hypothetical protein